ncbi:MAG TPA: cyclic nucleotide-binding domain-containing protein, partial [Gemmataceae bacterium]|nr:cyclic nucleotide-binding domain-containing protein [Gemmataceae bacterium]
TFAGHNFLRGLSERHLMKLASGVRPFTAQPGEYLAREGEVARAFYLIQAGRAELGVQPPGKEMIAVQVVGPGDVVGWSWLVPPYLWQFSCRALEPVRGLCLDAQWLREQCEQDHELGYCFLKHLLGVFAERLAATRRRLIDGKAR